MNFKSVIQNRMVFLAVIILLSIWGWTTQWLAYFDFYQSRTGTDIFLQRSAITFFLGWIFFLLIQFIKIPEFLKQKWIWLGLSLLLAVITPLIGYNVYGQYNYIEIFGFSIHSGYWILLFYIIYLAIRKDSANRNIHLSYKYSIFMEILVSLMILVSLIVYMETRIFFVLAAVIIVYFFIKGFKKTGAVVTAFVIASFVFLLLSNSYRINRITDYYTHQGNFHQVQQCLNSFKYGGLFGIGFEKTSRTYEKGNLLPETFRHSSFAVVIEHFGVLGGIFLIGFLTFIVYNGTRVYKKSKESNECILVGLLLLVFFIHNSVHILNCLNVFPFGSLLSFFSYGRDYFIINMILFGFIWKKYDK